TSNRCWPRITAAAGLDVGTPFRTTPQSFRMCGIAGVLAIDSQAGPVESEVVRRLIDFQKRRGPDGTGFWEPAEGYVALGHCRLAIIDVGADGTQPMRDATGRYVATFNGEIYNYRELRGELEALGRRFITRSDTEVLINAVAQWGEAGL